MICEAELRQAVVKEALSWLPTQYRDHVGIKHGGVDCAYFPLRVGQAVGLLPADYEPEKYHPMQWMKREEDPTYLNVVKALTKREITEAEVQPGDLVLWKVARSWTHGGIVISWPDYVLHPIKDRGLIGSHGINEGFIRTRQRRFFTII